MVKKNRELRAAAKAAGVFLYEIAEKFGVSENTFNRTLRTEQDEKWKFLALKYVKLIKMEHEREERHMLHDEMRAIAEEKRKLRKAEYAERQEKKSRKTV